MSGHCPTCTCRVRPRFVVDDLVLRRVVDLYRTGGVANVAVGLGRSTSQAYRLVQRARDAGLLEVGS